MVAWDHETNVLVSLSFPLYIFYAVSTTQMKLDCVIQSLCEEKKSQMKRQRVSVGDKEEGWGTIMIPISIHCYGLSQVEVVGGSRQCGFDSSVRWRVMCGHQTL